MVHPGAKSCNVSDPAPVDAQRVESLVDGTSTRCARGAKPVRLLIYPTLLAAVEFDGHRFDPHRHIRISITPSSSLTVTTALSVGLVVYHRADGTVVATSAAKLDRQMMKGA